MDPLTIAAIGWAFGALSWLLSPVLNHFLDKLFDALGMDLFQSRKQILFAKLDKLQTTLLPKLHILTDAAQQSSHRLFLEKWIQKLKSAFYEAEHVLNLVEYERLEKEVKSLFPPKYIEIKKPKLSSDQKDNLIKRLENLEKVVTEGIEFVSLLNLPSSSDNNNSHRETISTPGSKVIGRDKDCDDIIKLLEEDFPKSSKNVKPYSVIAIWGMGGSGKTTLAQFVCEHVKEKKCFELVIWVHVSENFNTRAIIKKMWESIQSDTERSCPDYENLDVLISQLCVNLKKKYLLVLDDVWCNKGVSQHELDQLLVPLNCGKQGSKILMTTRNEDAARILGARVLIKLPELADDDFLSLFMTHALSDVNINGRLEKRLRQIGVKIAGKLCQSPLVAITVARQLSRSQNPDFWLSILNKKFPDDVMGTLFLSYQHLHPALQRCFAFCSLFPKGQSFSREHLVNLWIAEGFIEIEVQRNNDHRKDIANQYFQELISRSLIQVDKMYADYYYMNDLIHDLAQLVSQSECCQIGSGEKKKIPIQTRHLYVVADMLGEYVAQICELNDLCTIIIPRSSSVPILNKKDLDTLFKKLSKLCVVELPHIKSLPESVVHLKNLRYLNCKIDQTDAILYKSLKKLYQLRVLCIFNAKHSPGSQVDICNVGRLILLQDLREFHVNEKKGFELKQLEHLSNLFGTLKIYGLHNVETMEEAHQAKLSEKKGLRNLHFYWDHESELRNNDAELLESLYPPPQIKELAIKGYRAESLPSWILQKNESIMHLDLQSLTISHLPELKSWVPLRSNLIRLELSHILSLAFAPNKKDLEDLEKMMSEKSEQKSQILTFPSNCRSSLEMIKQGDHIDEKTLPTISIDLNSCLKATLDLICKLKESNGKLYLSPALKLPLALEELTIRSCIITNTTLEGSMQDLKFLTHLILWNIITITCITNEMLSSLISLRVLHIHECMLLTSIDGWDTHSTLEKLEICCCPNLFLKASVVANNRNIVEQTPSSGKRKTTYSILNYVSLTACMPSDDSFQNLLSLETLYVWNCTTIKNPQIGHLKSLTYLGFHDCSNLVSLNLSKLKHLEKLKMIGCQELKSHSNADKLSRLKGLSVNKLSHIEQLISMYGFSALVSLELLHTEEEEFTKQKCEALSYLSSLEVIRFCGCKMIMLPDLSDLKALKLVYIDSCVNLTSLSELPLSIKRISIRNCSEKFTSNCRDPDDPNWQKISHIPHQAIWQEKIYDGVSTTLKRKRNEKDD